MNYLSPDGYTALHIAASYGFKNIVLSLLKEDKLDYEIFNRITPNTNAPTLLLMSVSRGWTDVVDMIAEKLSPIHVCGSRIMD